MGSLPVWFGIFDEDHTQRVKDFPEQLSRAAFADLFIRITKPFSDINQELFHTGIDESLTYAVNTVFSSGQGKHAGMITDLTDNVGVPAMKAYRMDILC